MIFYDNEGDRLDKIDTNCSSKGAVIEAISYVAPIVWQSSLHVVVHAPSGPEGTISPPPASVIEIVGIRFLRCHFDAIRIAIMLLYEMIIFGQQRLGTNIYRRISLCIGLLTKGGGGAQLISRGGLDVDVMFRILAGGRLPQCRHVGHIEVLLLLHPIEVAYLRYICS